MTNAVATDGKKVLAFLDKAGEKTVEAVEVVGEVAPEIIEQIASGKPLTAAAKAALETILTDGQNVGLAFVAAGGQDGANVSADTTFLAACTKFSVDFVAQLPALKTFLSTIESDVKTDVATAEAGA